MINLEATFPGQRTVSHPKKSDDERENGQQTLHIRNTIIKLIIDQTIGASGMLILFLSTITILRGGTVEDVVQTVQNVSNPSQPVLTYFHSQLSFQEYWPIMLSGLKVWPPVSLLSFTLIPVDKRMLFGSVCGFLWAIYLSLATA